MEVFITSKTWRTWHVLTLRKPEKKKIFLLGKCITWCVFFYIYVENMFQYTTGTSGLRRCKKCGQEEHDGRSQRQRTHAQRSDTHSIRSFMNIIVISLLTTNSISSPASLSLCCRFSVPAHPLHTARSTRDYLDGAEEVRLWWWPGAYTGIPVPHVSAAICFFIYCIYYICVCVFHTW